MTTFRCEPFLHPGESRDIGLLASGMWHEIPDFAGLTEVQ